MLVMGCDYHPGFQQIAYVGTETGELQERRLGIARKRSSDTAHSAKRRQEFESGWKRVDRRVGLNVCWPSCSLSCGWGDAAKTHTKRVRKQKTDRRDPQLLLGLMLENHFPRIWVANWENRDLRQLLWHRHRMVQMRTRLMNQLQAVALKEGIRRKKGLWREAGRKQLESLVLAPWASQRRHDLLVLLDGLSPRIAELSERVEEEAGKCPVAGRVLRYSIPQRSTRSCSGVCTANLDHRAGSAALRFSWVVIRVHCKRALPL